ncbi:MAG: CehA/McbA family metallohydrolase [Polyangiaceae bacterium]
MPANLLGMQLPRRRRLVAGMITAGLAIGALGLASCSRPVSHYAVEVAMTSAYRPDTGGTLWQHQKKGPAEEVLAGDMHCHVSPPDHPLEASRDPEATIALAREEQLDFVVLTPHVPARFFEDDGLRSAVLAEQDELRRKLAAQSDGRTVFVLGMEYTDHTYGHVGAAFADLRAVLSDVSAAEARANPARFFERFVARGGLLVIHHPLSVPLDSSIPMARANLSWRPFTDQGPFPAEIEAVNRLAFGIEAYNMVVTHLRDRYLLGDTPRSLRETLIREDQEILRQGRRLVPVGGTDSHSDYLRPATFVRAAARSEVGIRDALAGGRTCVRSAEACSFEVRAAGDSMFRGVGASLAAATTLEARASGGEVEVMVNGESAARGEDGEILRVTLPGSGCNVVRARVGEGYSAPIYVGCAFAD